jgi:hypothetical protein
VFILISDFSVYVSASSVAAVMRLLLTGLKQV